MNLFLTILLSVLAAGITAFGVVSVTNNSNNTNANTALPKTITPQVVPADRVALETENTDVVLEKEVSVSIENNLETSDANLVEEVGSPAGAPILPEIEQENESDVSEESLEAQDRAMMEALEASIENDADVEEEFLTGEEPTLSAEEEAELEATMRAEETE